MALIQIQNLSFTYDGSVEPVFDRVSFQIDTNWRLGLIGRNGRGKTTFLNLLMGRYAYTGSIRASLPFGYFPCPVADDTALTRDVMQSVSPESMEWEMIRELNLLNIPETCLDRPFCTLSGGEQTKVLLGAMFLEERFLLIDEPTNHLDGPTRQTVCAYLKKKKGFILVSHDRWLLDECVDHILSINKANIELRRGNFSTWQENKQRQDQFELAENEKLHQEIHRLEDTIRQRQSWSNTAEARKIGIDPMKVDNKKGYRPLQAAKSKKQMARAKAIENRQQAAIEEKSKLLHNIETQDTLKLFPAPFHKSRLITVQDLSFGYGETPLAEHLRFVVECGDRIAITGGNGSGKSSLLKLLMGEPIPCSGTLQIASGLTISYVSQDTSHLRGSLSEFARQMEIDETIFKTNLRKLDLPAREFDREIQHYSAGQKKKVLLAMSLSQQANLYIWDEPLNYIDIFSRIQLEEVILNARPTMLFVEHDQVFRDKIATKTIEL